MMHKKPFKWHHKAKSITPAPFILLFPLSNLIDPTKNILLLGQTWWHQPFPLLTQIPLKKFVNPPAGKTSLLHVSSSTSTIFLFSRSLVVIYGKWLELVQPSVRSSFCWVDFSNVYLFTFCALPDRSNLLHQSQYICMCMYGKQIDNRICKLANGSLYCVNAK